MPIVSVARETAFFTDTTAQPNETIAKLSVNIATFLTILCWIFVTLFIVSRFIPKLRKKFEEILGDNSFFLVWLIPIVAMLMSLFFSEYLGWRPCKLCWYQRIFMYSLALLMLIYWFKRIAIIRRISYLLVVIGASISVYHVAIEIDPTLESLSCDPNNPCGAPWFKSMGFLTTAGMALTAFITIGVLLYLTSRIERAVDSDK